MTHTLLFEDRMMATAAIGAVIIAAVLLVLAYERLSLARELIAIRQRLVTFDAIDDSGFVVDLEIDPCDIAAAIEHDYVFVVGPRPMPVVTLVLQQRRGSAPRRVQVIARLEDVERLIREADCAHRHEDEELGG